MKILILLSLCFVFTSCTKNTKPKVTLKDYRLSASKIRNVTSKLVLEKNAKKMNVAAVSLQQSRLVTCTDINNECSLFGKLMTKFINMSKDGVISEAERTELKSEHKNLLDALVKSEEALKEQWELHIKNMKAKK